MPNDALEQMIAESPALAPEAGDGAFTPDAHALDAQPLPEPVKAMVRQGVFAASHFACTAANVSHLETSEVDMLSEAVSGVLRFYITPDMDPKTAAWLGLGVTAMAVVSNRKPLPKPIPAPMPAHDGPSSTTLTGADGTTIST